MNLIKSYLRYNEISNQRKEVFDLLDSIRFEHNTENRLVGLNNIAMVLPSVYANLGGITSALRILVYMQKKGCNITVILDSKKQSIDEALNNAKMCLPDFSGRVICVEDAIREKFDICIATNWRTVFTASRINGYKVYFVQDYEANFYETNDFSVLAKETYSLGFHIISLGKWNLDMIRKNVLITNKGKMDSIDFPYDRNEYKYDGRDYLKYKNRKDIRIVCYIRFIGRRIPYICEYMLEEVRKELMAYGYSVEISFFGIDKKNRFKNATNLGKLTRSDLYNLYCVSDFGMVASMSNISLVPYEMLATGLPVIEFKAGSFPYFLGEDTAILTGYNPKELSTKILEVMNNPEMLLEMHNRAEKRLKDLSWDSTCEQFYRILDSAKLS